MDRKRSTTGFLLKLELKKFFERKMWHTYARCTPIAKIGLFQGSRLCNTKLKETLRVKSEVYRVSYGSQTLISVQENERREMKSCLEASLLFFRGNSDSGFFFCPFPIYLLCDVIFRVRIVPFSLSRKHFSRNWKVWWYRIIFVLHFFNFTFASTTHLTIKYKLNICYRCVSL